MQKQTKYIIFVLILTSMIEVSIGYLAAGLFPHEAVISAHIEPLQQLSSPLVTCYTFRFEQSTIFLTSPVNTSIYNGAKTADKSVTIHGNVSENIWLTDSYLSMVNDPGQNDFYRDLIDSFRKIRNRGGFDDDKYLELMNVYVQSLRYEMSGSTPVKFPIETFVEGAGDCDDKSLLLAGLLSREGYQVALFLFGHESHMAVGVGADDYLYKNTGLCIYRDNQPLLYRSATSDPHR